MSLSALVVLALLSADVAEARGKLGSRQKTKSDAIIHNKDFVHKLRACNAYAADEPVDVVHHPKGKGKADNEVLTKAGALEYKSCQDFAIHLLRGDSVEFTQNGTHVGSFAVASLPKRDALFLLVLHRRSAESKRPAFSSHIFNESPKSAQLAVLDVYNGPDKHNIQIRDAQKTGESSKTSRSEDLSYDTVVSITPGDYECGIKDSKKKLAKLQATNGESYIAMRVGLKGDSHFPEEVLVFPAASGASRICQGSVISLVVLLFLWQ